MLTINNIKIPVDDEKQDIEKEICLILGIENEEIKKFKLTGKAIDARKKSQIYFIYSAEIQIDNEDRFLKLPNVSLSPVYRSSPIIKTKKNKKVFIIGSGPAGLFCALTLVKAGIVPIIIERGKQVNERIQDIQTFFKDGKLNTESNIQFGEGGAGTFSDGKLTTNLRDSRIKLILSEFIEAGAPREIEYISKPHIGTDRLREALARIRYKLESHGAIYRFGHKFVSLTHENGFLKNIAIQHNNLVYHEKAETIVLAVGHSARDTIQNLYSSGIAISAKPFSVGVRIEHTQKLINKVQYGNYAPLLPPAEYKLNGTASNKRGVYTFCMCPGGVVVPASSEEKRICTNGMSYYSRNGINANSALLVNVYPSDFISEHPLSGILFQRDIEEKAFLSGGSDYKAPIQLVKNFLEDKKSTSLGSVIPTYAIGFRFADFREIFPDFIIESLKEGVKIFDRKLNGFASDDSVLTAAETRSSSPVKINRDLLFCSSVKGVFPCGEGAGYAGGIISAALDGIKCAQAIIESTT